MKRTRDSCTSPCSHEGGSRGASASAAQPDLERDAPSVCPVNLRFVDRGRLHQVELRRDAPLLTPSLSPPAEEYRTVIRAHYLQKLGMSRSQVAAELHRSETWVLRTWETAAASFPRPRGLPNYIVDYELRMLGASLEPFRPPELRRGYVSNASGLYEECARRMPWQQATMRRRNYDTGELTVTTVASNRQDCVCRGTRTGIAQLDDALRRVRSDLCIEDHHAFLVCNWYPDGRASIGAHSHDHWSAILSFGAPRVFQLADESVLLGDGDLLVFGTQRHSLPKMPDVTGGRISVAIFWYPEQRVPGAVKSLAAGRCARCGLEEVPLQEAPNGNAYCEMCWSECLQSRTREVGEAASVENDMLTAALQLSLVEQ